MSQIDQIERTRHVRQTVPYVNSRKLFFRLAFRCRNSMCFLRFVRWCDNCQRDRETCMPQLWQMFSCRWTPLRCSVLHSRIVSLSLSHVIRCLCTRKINFIFFFAFVPQIRHGIECCEWRKCMRLSSVLFDDVIRFRSSVEPGEKEKKRRKEATNTCFSLRGAWCDVCALCQAKEEGEKKCARPNDN